MTIERVELRDAYEDWMRQRRYQGELIGPSEFGEVLRALCPELGSTGPGGKEKRVWKNVLPSLKECRASFARAMGSVDSIEWRG